MKQLSICELCGVEATIYCPSDVAFLCCTCDAKVHDANFLVARHIRQEICSNFTGNGISGAVDSQHLPAICSSCPIEEDLDSVSSSTISSDCISSTSDHVKRKSDSISAFDSSRKIQRSRVDNCGAEGVFVNWLGKLGLGKNEEVVRIGCSGLKACIDRWKNVPFGICLAASMWFGLRLGYERTQCMLMRLEEISGVSAKVIVAVEAKLGRVLRGRRVQRRLTVEMEEGWAESQI